MVAEHGSISRAQRRGHRVTAVAVGHRRCQSRRMRIALASDHAGFGLKEEIKTYLASRGHETVDCGADDETPTDLVDHAYPAALAVGRGEVERAVLVDGVGYGSAMIANRVAGVDAVVCQDPFCAALARSHSDSNVLCLGGKIIGSALALSIVEVWMTTDFLADDPKYARRVAKAREIATRHLRPLDELGLPDHSSHQ
jgi:ribose 5-phosphate isomerase B